MSSTCVSVFIVNVEVKEGSRLWRIGLLHLGREKFYAQEPVAPERRCAQPLRTQDVPKTGFKTEDRVQGSDCSARVLSRARNAARARSPSCLVS